jgi:hypothetical protein
VSGQRRSAQVLLLLATVVPFGAVLAMAPMAGDEIIIDGPAGFNGDVWSHDFTLWPARPVGLYLAIAGVERFQVRLNDSLVAAVRPGPAPRTLIRTLDLSTRANLLRPGVNRLTLVAAAPADSFAVRFWAGPKSWHVGSSHTHTVYSDGVLTVHELLARAERDGGRFLGITDHNTMAQCDDTAFHAVNLLEPIRGMEWTTDSGHANLLGLQGPAAVATGSIPAMIDDASYRGALVHINHPRAHEWRWHRYPLLDPGIDGIELINGRTGFAENEALAVDWWHSLLVAGHAIAGVGSSDFHGDNQSEKPLQACSRVWASANHPDTILRACKRGRVMACDRPDGSRVYLYADTSGNGQWDLSMGDIITTGSGSRPVRFRVEVESVSPNDELRVLDRSGEVFRTTFTAAGDFGHEWSTLLCLLDSGFVRAELRRANGHFGVLTNPIYVNHPGYELGPVGLATDLAIVFDQQSGPGAVRLEIKVENRGACSPHRFGLAVALDTVDWRVLAAETESPGRGVARRTRLAGYHLLEWQGGFESGWRLRPGGSVTSRVRLRSLRPGIRTVLYRSWADDRLFEVAADPDTGVPGPGGRPWHSRAVSIDDLDVRDVSVGQQSAPVFAATVTSVTRGKAMLTVDMPKDAPALEARVIDCNGRSRLKHRLLVSPGTGRAVSFDLANQRGTRLPPGVYFLHLRAGGRTLTRRLLTIN